MAVRLETPRLKLSRFTLSDADELFQCITPSITRFMAWDPPTIDAYKSRCEELCQADETIELQFVIRRKDTGECLGVAGVQRLGDPMPELGVWMKQTAQGKGLGREAVEAVTSWASRVWKPEGFIYPVAVENLPGRRIAERLGGRIIAKRPSPKYDFVVYKIPRLTLG